MSSAPILSIIIPTYNRSEPLFFAIESAIASAPDEDFEIIVVPNGSSQNWKRVALHFNEVSQIKWHPIKDANACKARNHGLTVSRGKYIRFLDDDDLLLEGAKNQLLEHEASNVDVSQGEINFINNHGELFNPQPTQCFDDFIVSLLTPNIFTLLHSFLWKRSIRIQYPWNEKLTIGDDVDFALRPALTENLSFIHCKYPVGAWIHHDNFRLSRSQHDCDIALSLCAVLIYIANHLPTQDPLNKIRRDSIVRHLWNFSHGQFPNAPIKFSKIIKEIQKISPGSRPDIDILGGKFMKHISPVFFEWIMTPHRKIRNTLNNK